MKRNRDETRAARLIQDVTGVRYTMALRTLRLLTPDAREVYLDRVEAVPEAGFGSKDFPLCTTCLVPDSAFHECP